MSAGWLTAYNRGAWCALYLQFPFFSFAFSSLQLHLERITYHSDAGPGSATVGDVNGTSVKRSDSPAADDDLHISLSENFVSLFKSSSAAPWWIHEVCTIE